MSFWVEKKRNGTTEKNKKVGKKKTTPNGK